MMPHNKYQGSKPYGFRQEYFFLCFSLYVKRDCQGSHFWPQGYNLNKLGRGSLGDASYQISRLKALWFQTRIFFYVSSYISLCKMCDPGAIFGPPGII